MVYVGETRPLLQGSRLTAWELERLGADYQIVVDGAGPGVMARGMVDAVVVGADRVAANGDVVNKVGTFPLALAATRAGVPFVVAAPESTSTPKPRTATAVPIELRSPDEVLMVGEVRIAPDRGAGPEPRLRRHSGRAGHGAGDRAEGGPPRCRRESGMIDRSRTT